jgi:hypothetical protein
MSTEASHEDPTTGALVARLSEDLSTLVRDEMRLAQTEMTQKAKRVGIGAGLFSTAGVLTLYAVGVLIAAGILALSLVLPGWAAALIVAGVLLAGAVGAALGGKREVEEATPPVPTEAVESVKQDVATIRGDRS